MPDLIPVLKKEEIEKIVSDLARSISTDYLNQELILIGILKGAFIFLADLVRNLSIPVKIDFIGLSSYGSSASSCGKIEITKDLQIGIKGKHVLIIEDIIDSGLSLACLLDYLKKQQPATLKICAMIDKRERREEAIELDYVGYVVDEGFLVGYGLDYAEEYRNLPSVYHLKL